MQEQEANAQVAPGEGHGGQMLVSVEKMVALSGESTMEGTDCLVPLGPCFTLAAVHDGGKVAPQGGQLSVDLTAIREAHSNICQPATAPKAQ